jgi:alkylation response protein AidB-like acyl-CoA dehydrogenase
MPTPQTTETVDRLRVRVYPDRQAMGAAAAGDVAARLRALLAGQARVRAIFASAPSQDELLAGLADERLLLVRDYLPAARSSAREGDAPDGPGDAAGDAAAQTSAAKVLAGDAARLVARTAIQCHGAMGYTTEYDLHLFAKRAWALVPAWGSPGWHRARLADALHLGG